MLFEDRENRRSQDLRIVNVELYVPGKCSCPNGKRDEQDSEAQVRDMAENGVMRLGRTAKSCQPIGQGSSEEEDRRMGGLKKTSSRCNERRITLCLETMVLLEPFHFGRQSAVSLQVVFSCNNVVSTEYLTLVVRSTAVANSIHAQCG
jgi:hypothetical protein